MTKRVIFLNGPMGVEKTTVGRLIQRSLPQCAFIDGDWCLDLEPFIGNSEARTMAVDNILHMLVGYKHCSQCRDVVVSWLMDRLEVCRALDRGAQAAGLEPVWFTLLCAEQALRVRWQGDELCPWRTEENLKLSIRSLERFAKLPGVRIDTTGRTAEQVQNSVLALLDKRLGESMAAEEVPD